eukprot:Gb_11315 [translate_table: standard]
MILAATKDVYGREKWSVQSGMICPASTLFLSSMEHVSGGAPNQPKWNNALLEVFRIDYVGMAPYITCTPSLCHHRLGPNDHFLVLSSDGLYQYLSNEEVVSHVESFMEKFPEGDPAQHLIEELLFRAAKKNVYRLLFLFVSQHCVLGDVGD